MDGLRDAARWNHRNNPDSIGSLVSFTLYNQLDIAVHKAQAREKIPLSLPGRLIVEPLSFAQVDHNLRIEQHGGPVILWREPLAWDAHCLLVDQGPIEDGPIYTKVFNMSEKRAWVNKLEVLSWLMEM